MRQCRSEEHQLHRNRGIPLPYLRELRQSRGLSQKELGELARIYRKLARRKVTGSLRGITVFIRHEDVVRLLEFLGYTLE